MLLRFFAVMLLISATVGFAAEKKPLFKEIQMANVSEVLRRLPGKNVTLMLSNGTSISGVLPAEDIDYGSSFTKMVHLQKIVGQDYSDAVILMNSIVGIIMRNPDAPIK